MESGPESKPISKAEAMAFIESLKAVVYPKGANESEMQDLENLQRDVENDVIDPAVAMRRAEALNETKMDNY